MRSLVDCGISRTNREVALVNQRRIACGARVPLSPGQRRRFSGVTCHLSGGQPAGRHDGAVPFRVEMAVAA